MERLKTISNIFAHYVIHNFKVFIRLFMPVQFLESLWNHLNMTLLECDPLFELLSLEALCLLNGFQDGILRAPI